VVLALVFLEALVEEDLEVILLEVLTEELVVT
jgi:hypothetical protein